MTHQQELELLAEWMGYQPDGTFGKGILVVVNAGKPDQQCFGFDPSPEGNDTDFLNMVAGRVDIDWHRERVRASIYGEGYVLARFADHNNDKLAAMKHAAYQVCLMAAREWKGEQ